MKEFLQTLFKSTEDRIKNPFIGTFITSWVIFNWKPILYLIFSDENIRDRITYITTCYSNVWCYFLLPLFSAIFYIAILPYVNWGFEYLVSFSLEGRNNVSLKSRNENLKMQIKLAQNEILFEEEKTTFRERNTHNNLVETLQKQVESLELRLDESTKKNIEIATRYANDKKSAQDKLDETISEYDKDLEKLRMRYEEISQHNKKLEKENRDKLNQLSLYDLQGDITNDLLDYFVKSRLSDKRDKIIEVDGKTILEYFTPTEEIIYYDTNDQRIYSTRYMREILSNNKFVFDFNPDIVTFYKEKVLNLLTPNQKAQYGIISR